jgi:hypothetical protein
VIHPMGVVDSAGKDRLIMNGMYLNLFLEALPFKYEKLRDILGFIKEGSFMASWDLKSGYFHLPIHRRIGNTSVSKSGERSSTSKCYRLDLRKLATYSQK